MKDHGIDRVLDLVPDPGRNPSYSGKAAGDLEFLLELHGAVDIAQREHDADVRAGSVAIGDPIKRYLYLPTVVEHGELRGSPVVFQRSDHSDA